MWITLITISSAVFNWWRCIDDDDVSCHWKSTKQSNVISNQIYAILETPIGFGDRLQPKHSDAFITDTNSYLSKC